VQGATRKEDFLALLKQHHASGCGWVGAISGLSSHLAADCMLETVPCSNAGCSATLQRRDLENHGMYCDFRQVLPRRRPAPSKSAKMGGMGRAIASAAAPTCPLSFPVLSEHPRIFCVAVILTGPRVHACVHHLALP
jgi:hypothetical protein